MHAGLPTDLAFGARVQPNYPYNYPLEGTGETYRDYVAFSSMLTFQCSSQGGTQKAHLGKSTEHVNISKYMTESVQRRREHLFLRPDSEILDEFPSFLLLITLVITSV